MNSHLIPIFTFSLATFLLGFLIMPYFIRFLIHFRLGKQIRSEATIGKAIEFLKLHKEKTGTPTMGWLVILWVVFFMVALSMFLQYLGLINNSLLNQKETYLSLFTFATVGILWAIDDYMNVRGIGRTKWLSARFKMFWLLLFAGLGAMWFYYKLGWNVVDDMWNFVRSLKNPFWENIELGIYFIPLFIFIIVATANSVNITDGLDGLAGWLLLFIYGVYAFITYDQWLYLLSTLCVTIMGALMAFLWYNIKPAKFYMWDVGSLALWANLWIMAMITNTVFVLIIAGFIFILETLSVIIQLTSKKLRKGKKVFRIAPFHHHLEAVGWSEETVVFRLWLVGIILSIIWLIIYSIK